MKKRIRQAIRMGALLQSVVLLAGCGANGSTSSGSSTSLLLILLLQLLL